MLYVKKSKNFYVSLFNSIIQASYLGMGYVKKAISMKQQVGIILVLAMLLVMQTAVSATITRVEETDASFVWSGAWLSEENTGASGGTWKVTSYMAYGTVNSVDITFTGIGITLITVGGPNCGIMKVKIDGKSYPDIDMYYPSNTLITKTIAKDLTNTQHVLTISPSYTKNPKSTDTVILVDAVDITLPTPTPTPTAIPSPTPAPTPGFEAVFAIAGLLAVVYLLRRRK